MTEMYNHFSELSTSYNEVRTTDPEPVRYIHDMLHDRGHIQGADIGCGAGRYDLLLLRQIHGLHLTCCDVNEGMLEETARYLKANKALNFQTLRVDASDLQLPAGTLDCVLSFNAIHHFDPVVFLERATRLLRRDGYVFVYTRLKSQNARNIWGRLFPHFCEKEDRLYELSHVEGWAERIESLYLEAIQFFRFERVASLAQLLKKVEDKHYSTFSLYEPVEFRRALQDFQRTVASHFDDLMRIRWTDENVMLVFRKDGV